MKNKAIDFIKNLSKPDQPMDKSPDVPDPCDIIVAEFQTFLNEDLLLNSNLDLKQTYGISIPISWDTARLWMHTLGFGFSDVKKDIYYDGHDRPDVVIHRNGLIGRYFEWADVAAGIPGYDRRAHHFVHFRKNKHRPYLELAQYSVPARPDLYEFYVDDWDIDRGNFGPLGGSLSLKLNFEGQPIMIIVQDESIFKSYDASKKVWKLETGRDLEKGMMA